MASVPALAMLAAAALSLLPAAAMAQAPAAAAAPAPVAAPAAAAPAQRAPDRFEIQAIDVAGVTKLSATEIERAVYPFTGPERTSDDAEKARAAVQAAYSAKGLEAVVVELPPQDDALFRQGIITIKVSEVPVARVRVVDSKYHPLETVRADVPSLKVGEPLNLKALQSDLEAANRVPDRTITPSFKPGLVPGTVEVDLKVRDRLPLHASVEVSNDRSPNTEELRVTAAARYTNVWNLGHTVSFSYTVAPQNRSQSEVFSGSYTAPIGASPWSILVFGYTSNSNVAALGGTNVLGNGYQVGLRAIYRLPSTDSFQSISFGPDLKDFAQDIFVGGVAAGTAPIRYVPLTAEYNFAKETGNTSFDASLGGTFGLRLVRRNICLVDATSAICPNFQITPTGCFVTDPATGQQLPCTIADQFRNREVDSNENFVRITASANYTRALKADFIVAARLSAQIADSHLVTNEQFSIGGLTSVRGYLLSEGVGDDGAVGSVELRAPSLAGRIGGPVDEARLFAFVDAGYARVRRVLAGQQSEFSLGSGGAGFRLRMFGKLSGEVLVAVPFLDGPFSKAGDPRLTFSAKGDF